MAAGHRICVTRLRNLPIQRYRPSPSQGLHPSQSSSWARRSVLRRKTYPTRGADRTYVVCSWLSNIPRPVSFSSFSSFCKASESRWVLVFLLLFSYSWVYNLALVFLSCIHARVFSDFCSLEFTMLVFFSLCIVYREGYLLFFFVSFCLLWVSSFYLSICHSTSPLFSLLFIFIYLVKSCHLLDLRTELVVIPLLDINFTSIGGCLNRHLLHVELGRLTLFGHSNM